MNRNLENGRSWSIHLGLQQVLPGAACFIQNIDNPFLGKLLLEKLLSAVPADGYSVPVYKGRGGHPMLLGSGVADTLRRWSGLTDFREELRRFNRIEVPYPDERILWNINTPEDYKEFTEWGMNSSK